MKTTSSQTLSDNSKRAKGTAKEEMELHSFINDTNRSIRHLYWLHALVSALLVALAVMLLSCSKPEEKADYGPTYPVETKDEVVDKAMGNRSFLDVTSSETVIANFAQKAFTGPYEVTGSIGKGIYSRTNYEDQIWIKRITLEKTYKSDGTSHENKYIDEFCLKNNPPRFCRLEQESNQSAAKSLKQKIGPDQAKRQDGNELTGILNRKMAETMAGEKLRFSSCQTFSTEEVGKLPPGYQVTYHNLSQTSFLADPPDLVKSSPNCGGIPKCKINVKRVEYDEVLWNEIGGNDRYHCAFEFSDDVPYLANMTKNCIDFLAKIQEKKVPVQLCAVVMNFTKGN